MKRSEPQQVGKLIERFINDSGATGDYNAAQVCFLWPEVVGPTINRFTVSRWIKNKELHVVIASGVMKNEVSFMATAILERLNALAGAGEKPIVDRLIVH